MAILRRLRNLKSEINKGFGTNSSSTGGRFINKDGKPNEYEKMPLPEQSTITVAN